MRSRRPWRRRPTPPRRRSTPSSRWSRCRSTSAARRRSSTSAATPTSRRRTAAARCSIPPSKFRSRSAIPASRSAPTSSPRWRRTTPACAGASSPSTTATTPRTRSTASPFRRRSSTASAPTALPRSSIVISDEPLSNETNYRTEFVAVLSNQPQGGFITRKPTPPISWCASDRSNDGWGFFFGRSPEPQPVNPRQRGGQQYYRQGQPQPQPVLSAAVAAELVGAIAFSSEACPRT